MEFVVVLFAILCVTACAGLSDCESLINDAIKNNDFKYVIVDIVTVEVDVVFTEQSFNEKIKDIDFYSEWIKTKPTPKDATFGE